MTVHELIQFWEQSSSDQLTENVYSIRLPMEDAAKIEALAEMYPKRRKEAIITDLLSAALNDLLSDMPYKQGKHIIGKDEEGDSLYEDIGPTPRYLDLTIKHVGRFQQVHDRHHH